MSDDLNRQAFREEAYELLGELESTLLELEQSPQDLDLVNRVFRALHTIKGSGAMFGFDDIAAFTHDVETVFDMVRNEQLAVSTELLNIAFRVRDQLQLMLDAPEGGGGDQAAQREILEELRHISGKGGEEGQAGAGSDEPMCGLASGTVAPADEALRTYRIRVRPKGGDAPEGFTLEPVLAELAKLGQLEAAADPDCGPCAQVLHLACSCSAEHIRDVFFFSPFDVDLAVEPLDGAAHKVHGEEPPGPDVKKIGEILVEQGIVEQEDVEQALAQQKPVGQILADSGKVTPEQLREALASQQAAKDEVSAKCQKEAVSSIRVAAEKLDRLVDLVGELVIVQAQLTQVVSERHDAGLTALSEQLERLSDALRDSTLGIRMLPIGTTFSKYRRLVRDLASEFGKDIALNTQGAETELDKTVIERLGDPLMHLLRNSIDHGIEPPEERLAAGKPGQGCILLSAEHSGGEVLIRISDDGRGLDPDAIRAKAVEKGLLQPDADPSEKELFKLIFEPGFSTAKKLTSVSGRGVGMDVVKRSIDALRGSVEIQSVRGKGSTIVVRLPLTLAIIDGLQVKVGEEYFVIPLALVEECVELTRAQLEDAGNQRIMHLRGEIVPYIHLRRWFSIDGDAPVIEQIVITRVEGSRMGIVVDSVIGEHQTVIKTLGRVYKDVEGISGATIKGDGSIALIIDVPRLVRGVVQETRQQ